MKNLALILIRTYQCLISPFLGNRCRYYPSCSAYAQDAIKEFGLKKGFWLALKRLGRCHPGHEGGVDFVPTNKENLN